ncbi:hypothetical protein N24_0961 [Corynebacterium suranareeae]|uniref:Uncharacterized protein n=1 Tax=Corynebacterium suranareeae TaxID=2506452 RepID=A0A160PQG4_9CORY|nr:hypothetical protein N24_0961 [Corynebacterium suranareeae]
MHVDTDVTVTGERELRIDGYGPCEWLFGADGQWATR